MQFVNSYIQTMTRNQTRFVMLLLLLTSCLIGVHLTWRHVSILGQRRYTELDVQIPSTREFKILQIADVQIANMKDDCKDLTAAQRHWPCSGKNSTSFIQRLIHQDRPNIVVFTGDNVYGTESDQRSQQLLKKITASVVAASIPFALVTGNHDVEQPWMSISAMHEFMRRDRAHQGGGALLSGNGLIRFRSRDNKTRIDLWLLEYMHRFCILCYNGAGHGAYHAVTREQVDMFRHQTTSNVVSLAFSHVPIPEYHDVVKRRGDFMEPISDGGYSALYKTMLQKNVTVLSVGHDHINNFCGRLQRGPYLCYGGGSGYTTYGVPGWPRRARVFTVVGEKVQTYVRLDDENFSKIHEQRFDLQAGRA